MLVLATLNPNILLNCGTARVARAILPKGSVMNAVPPAAVGMRSLTCVLTQGVVLSAFSKALPDRLAANPAGVPSLVNVKTSDRQGNPYMASIGPVGGGAGGSATSDGGEGAGATHSFVRNTPIEINESELPIRILRYGIVGDTGGPGTWRGGSAMIMEFQVFAPGSIVTARNRDRSLFASAGICGGLPGAYSLFRKNPGTNREENLLNSDVVACNPGDVISLQGSGGGGYGNPMKRSTALVIDDVQRGLLSIERARLDYGVAIKADGSIDEEATQRLRSLPVPIAKDFFSYCANRRAFEGVWTDERYAALTRFLADIPVSWRFFVKHRIFGATQSAVADPRLDVPDIELLFREVLAEFPDLAERR
jgi:N-methylhydantoinase B